MGREHKVKSETAIFAKMRAARVPPHAYSHSLESLKQTRLASVIRERRFDLGVGGLSSYLITPAAPTSKKVPVSVPMVCAVAAKELVLLGREVRYYTLAGLLMEIEAKEIWEVAGRGYFVIGDLGENTQHWQAKEWDTAQDVLLHHTSRGAGLILGDTGAVNAGYFSGDLTEALSMFDVMLVE